MNIPAPTRAADAPAARAIEASAALMPLRTLPASTLDIVVIGASLGGLAATIAAAEAGMRVLLLEARADLGPHEASARLAERARQSGALLAGEARVLGYAEERGSANSAHWRLDVEGGITIPARGLIVAHDEGRPTSRGAQAPAVRRLEYGAPGVALDVPPSAGMPASIDLGWAAGAEVARELSRGDLPPRLVERAR